MARDARLDRFELFAAAACLAAQTYAGNEGFRQRDMRFFIELFSNWVETSLDAYAIPVANIQVSRYLAHLVREGFARNIARKDTPNYRLTRVGLLELLTRIVNSATSGNREHFFFLYYFIKNYRLRIEALIQAEGQQFPYALKLEVEALLDVKTLLSNHITRTQKEIKRLESRTHDAEKTAELAITQGRKGTALKEIVAQAEKLYPYELNNQKPLRELIFEIPEDMRRWELEEGNKLRVAEIWNPLIRLLKRYLNELESLNK